MPSLILIFHCVCLDHHISFVPTHARSNSPSTTHKSSAYSKANFGRTRGMAFGGDKSALWTGVTSRRNPLVWRWRIRSAITWAAKTSLHCWRRLFVTHAAGSLTGISPCPQTLTTPLRGPRVLSRWRYKKGGWSRITSSTGTVPTFSPTRWWFLAARRSSTISISSKAPTASLSRWVQSCGAQP